MDPRLRGDDSGRSSIGNREGVSLFLFNMVDDRESISLLSANMADNNKGKD